MSAAEMARALRQLGLGRFVAEFAADGVDMARLRAMDDQDLEDLGLPAEDRQVLLESLENGSSRSQPRQAERRASDASSVSCRSAAMPAPTRHRRRDSVASTASSAASLSRYSDSVTSGHGPEEGRTLSGAGGRGLKISQNISNYLEMSQNISSRHGSARGLLSETMSPFSAGASRRSSIGSGSIRDSRSRTRGSPRSDARQQRRAQLAAAARAETASQILAAEEAAESAEETSTSVFRMQVHQLTQRQQLSPSPTRNSTRIRSPEPCSPTLQLPDSGIVIAGSPDTVGSSHLQRRRINYDHAVVSDTAAADRLARSGIAGWRARSRSRSRSRYHDHDVNVDVQASDAAAAARQAQYEASKAEAEVRMKVEAEALEARLRVETEARLRAEAAAKTLAVRKAVAAQEDANARETAAKQAAEAQAAAAAATQAVSELEASLQSQRRSGGSHSEPASRLLSVSDAQSHDEMVPPVRKGSQHGWIRRHNHRSPLRKGSGTANRILAVPPPAPSPKERLVERQARAQAAAAEQAAHMAAVAQQTAAEEAAKIAKEAAAEEMRVKEAVASERVEREAKRAAEAERRTAELQEALDKEKATAAAAAASRMEERSLQAEAQARRHAEAHQRELELQAAQLATLKEQLQATTAAATSQRATEAKMRQGMKSVRSAAQSSRTPRKRALKQIGIADFSPGQQYVGPIVPHACATTSNRTSSNDHFEAVNEGDAQRDTENNALANMASAESIYMAKDDETLEDEAKLLLQDLRAAQDAHYAQLLVERDRQLQEALAAQGKLAGQLSRATEEYERLRASSARAGARRFCRRILGRVVQIWSEKTRFSTRALRIVRRLQGAHLWNFFCKWRSLTCDAATKRLRQHKGTATLIGRLLHRELARSWLSWCSYLRRRRLQKKIVARMMRSRLAKAFSSFVSGTAQAAGYCRKRQSMSTYLSASIDRSLLRRVFDMLLVKLHFGAKQMARLAAWNWTRLWHAHAIKLLQAWARATTTMSTARVQAMRIGFALHERIAAKAFGSWLAFNGRQQAWRASLGARFGAAHLQRAWDTWKREVAGARRRRVSSSYCRTLRRRLLLGGVMGSWRRSRLQRSEITLMAGMREYAGIADAAQKELRELKQQCLQLQTEKASEDQKHADTAALRAKLASQNAQLARLRSGLGDDPTQRARLHILESECRTLQEQLRRRGSADSQEVVNLSLRLAEERGANAELERQLLAAGKALRQATSLLKTAVVDGKRLTAADLLPLDVLGEYDLGNFTSGVYRESMSNTRDESSVQHTDNDNSQQKQRVGTLRNLPIPQNRCFDDNFLRGPPDQGQALPNDLEQIYQQMQDEAGQLQGVLSQIRKPQIRHNHSSESGANLSHGGVADVYFSVKNGDVSAGSHGSELGGSSTDGEPELATLERFFGPKTNDNLNAQPMKPMKFPGQYAVLASQAV